jgi:hypothetical protein
MSDMINNTVMKSLPKHVHTLNIFFSVALYKHEVLFSLANQKKIEQWIEASARLHLHDKTVPQRHLTAQWLSKNKSFVWKNAEALFSFEGIIHNKISPTMKKQEAEIIAAWDSFYVDIENILK